MNFLKNLFGNKDTTSQIADFLKTDRNAPAEFEKSYAAHSISDSDNYFDINSRDAAAQNGNDFRIIDMAVAENSAFYDYVPENLRRPTEENRIPDTKAIRKAISPSQEIKKG